MPRDKENQEDFVETVDKANAQARCHGDVAQRDQAVNLIEETGHPVILTPENNARVLRKIDLSILPLILGIYFLQALDKATLAYGSVFGLIDKAHLHGLEYSWLGSVVYLAQLVVQPIVAYVLVKAPLGKFLAISIFVWGLVLSAMIAATTFPGLLVCRMLLGVFEAGIAPAFIAVTQMWWRRREQPMRLGAWYAMNGITNMVGSLLTYALGHIQSPIFEAYQIIFLFFGLITVALSFVVLAFMPDSPLTAKYLKKEDKLVAIERLRMNQQGIKNTVWKWDHIKEACLDLKTWLWFAMLFVISIPSGGISTFGPLIVQSFGFDQFKTVLFNIPFGAVQLFSTVGGAWLAMVWKVKGPVLMLLSIPPIIGCVMLLTIAHDGSHRGPLLAGYYLISVYPGITPLIYSWSAANTAGETKKKVTTAVLIVGQCTGNVIGPTLYTTAEAPLYTRGLRSNLALFVILIALYAINAVYLYILNTRHQQERERLGKERKVVDWSMQVVRTVDKDKETALPAGEVQDNSLNDVTDIKNEDFVYVY